MLPNNSDGSFIDCPAISFYTEKLIKVSAPKFFTPNNGGANDLWRPNVDLGSPISQTLIFDRYGKLLKQLTANEYWDGSYNSIPQPSSSYWHQINLGNGKVINGYFMLKR